MSVRVLCALLIFGSIAANAEVSSKTARKPAASDDFTCTSVKGVTGLGNAVRSCDSSKSLTVTTVIAPNDENEMFEAKDVYVYCCVQRP